ncbi:3-hydroxyacyl-ACP dehydratase FabZ [Magnetofaba australis]|uniref:3-hydroxyacyl-[acyl-carrier-protein] dehydratase FabZ n=1 Tax=Magnetofaba australis IT-1 TaxID=1434232 RepID=A0A1Y2K908_9PROT|nr:3-hydroxyacyl-ACP dehydratase FabZ [Magnetofaba australis]OSM05166.1 putative 3-hydroxyacyl-[acyl-carrier-protein] dehydratase [Magnetofaba australis IT-1]
MAQESFDLHEILESLPHRYPFLLVDRIVDFKAGEYLRAIKNVTFNEPHFQGHFPGEPVMPGVLILEAMAQAGALFAARTDPENVRGQLVYFMAIDKAKFRKPVVPGHQLVLDLKLIKRRRDVWRFEGKAFADDELAAEAELMAMTRKRDDAA